MIHPLFLCYTEGFVFNTFLIFIINFSLISFLLSFRYVLTRIYKNNRNKKTGKFSPTTLTLCLTVWYWKCFSAGGKEKNTKTSGWKRSRENNNKNIYKFCEAMRSWYKGISSLSPVYIRAFTIYYSTLFYFTMFSSPLGIENYTFVSEHKKWKSSFMTYRREVNSLLFLS